MADIREGKFVTMVVDDGYPSIVWVPDTRECICPQGLPGTDMCCRAHEQERSADARSQAE